MGKRGKPRKPTKRHKIMGSYRADRHGTDEPEPPAGESPCPDWVIGDARQHWNLIVPMLEGMGIMSPAYSAGLGLLVNSLGRYVEYEKRVSKSGPVSVTDKGNEIVSPWWAARNKAWDQVMKALGQYGLTPSAVSSVKAIKSDDDSEQDSMESVLKLA
jgi:P27 family predicted phage terminase small subunit